MERPMTDSRFGPARRVMVEVEIEGENLVLEGELRLPVEMEEDWPLDTKLRGKLIPEARSSGAVAE